MSIKNKNKNGDMGINYNGLDNLPVINQTEPLPGDELTEQTIEAYNIF